MNILCWASLVQFRYGMVYFWSHESAEFDIIYFVFLMCVVCLTYFKGTFVIAFGVVVLLAFSMASR